ncbi:MAG: glycosyltransferase family 1 protein [Tissierellales bacterium]|nr:glycosyltransferase family 1 protein [Tissierellales bacterium]
MERVLHILDSLSINSGVSAVVMNYYRRMDKTQIQFDFLVFNNTSPDYMDEIIALGGHVFQMPKIKLRTIGSFLYETKCLFAKQTYKIVHLHAPNAGFLFFPFAKFYNVQNLIMHSHSTKYADTKLKAFRNFWLVQLAKIMATDYFACSQMAASFMFGRKYSENHKAKIIKNGININRFSFNESTRINKRKELGLQDKLIIGHIGRFSKQKNHGFLIDVFGEIIKNNDQAVLILLGDGELRPVMQQKVNEMNLHEKVFFLGIRSDIPELLNAMDLFVFPSLYEGLGIVLIEAQCAGLRCIATESVIPKDTGITELIQYLPLDLKKWTDAVVSIINTVQDDRMDKSDRIRKSDFDIIYESIKLKDIYNEMLSK